MLMDFDDLVARHYLDLSGGVLAVGAHLAEEADMYARYAPHVTWVEADPALIGKIEKRLRDHPGQRVIQGLVWSEPGINMDFHRTNHDGMSSSVYRLGRLHREFSPDTVPVDTIRLDTTTIDDLVARHGIEATFASFDIQGAEHDAFRGAEQFLTEQCTALICEVNKAQVYDGIREVDDVRDLLGRYGFVEADISWVTGPDGRPQHWGDMLAVKR